MCRQRPGLMRGRSDSCGGSKASAVAGADGSCYALASELGHQIIKPLPALTGLKCQNSSLSLWAGVRTEAAVQLFIDGNLSGKEYRRGSAY